MPPSGYKADQRQYIQGFLTSCGEALKAEADEKNRSYANSVRSEIDNIDKILDAPRQDLKQGVNEDVLRATKAFYEALRQRDLSGEESFKTSLRDAAEDVAEGLKAVEVPEIQA